MLAASRFCGAQLARSRSTFALRSATRSCLFSSLPSNLTLAEPAPPPAAPATVRENYVVRGGEVHVDVEAFFEGGDAPSASGAGASLALPELVFGAPLRIDVLHDCVKWQRNKKRQVHRASKRRGEVAGSTRKLYRQKGTGNARAGSLRSPLRKGGAKAHGPTARDFKTDLNKKQRKFALRVALSAKLRPPPGAPRGFSPRFRPRARARLRRGPAHDRPVARDAPEDARRRRGPQATHDPLRPLHRRPDPRRLPHRLQERAPRRRPPRTRRQCLLHPPARPPRPLRERRVPIPASSTPLAFRRPVTRPRAAGSRSPRA